MISIIIVHEWISPDGEFWVLKTTSRPLNAYCNYLPISDHIITDVPYDQYRKFSLLLTEYGLELADTRGVDIKVKYGIDKYALTTEQLTTNTIDIIVEPSTDYLLMVDVSSCNIHRTNSCPLNYHPHDGVCIPTYRRI